MRDTLQLTRNVRYEVSIINTIIKTSVCDASSVGGWRGWLAGDTDGLVGWPATVGLVEVGVVDTRYGVSQPGDAERYRCACLHCTQGLAWRMVTDISASSIGGVLVMITRTNVKCDVLQMSETCTALDS